jgi:hypothetical protein
MFTELALTSLFALSALASLLTPHAHALRHLQPRDSTFNITVKNSCAATIYPATYSISSSFVMTQESSGASTNVVTSYTATGMRLSPNGNWPLAQQWNDQPLFEYGYGAFNGVAGTAYDLSLMKYVATAPDTGGLKVVPANSQCETKTCTPSNCPADQGWTDTSDGNSAADTGCY